MKNIEVHFFASVEDDAVDDFKIAVENHVDRLIDFDEWPEIEAIYNAKANVKEEL